MGTAARASQPDREMSLRYAGVCTACGVEIPRNARAIYSPSTRSVHHTVCPGDDLGDAGGSALREYERRAAKDQAQVEQQTQAVQAVFGHGIVGKIATKIVVDDSPRVSTSVWKQGAIGEQRVAERLDGLAADGVVTLHDRRVPGTRANIDHIAVTAWGVCVIDAKRYIGKRPDFIMEGTILGFGGTPRLTVGGRRKDHLIDGVLHQCQLVSDSVSDQSIPVRGCLCFVDGDWPLIGGDFTIRSVMVCWPKLLTKLLLQPGADRIDQCMVAQRLASSFPSA